MKVNVLGHRRAALFMLSALLVVAMACVAMPSSAWAYYSLSPVEIYLGSNSISMGAGESASIGCGLSIASEEQTVGCGMAECPQGCGDLTTPQGVKGGCADVNGWCTCMGTAYSAYGTNVAVYSDNPGVARASYSNGVLNVTSYGAGSATLTVSATLQQHNDAAAYVTVDVSDNNASSGGSGNSGGSGSYSGGSTTVVPTDSVSGGSGAAASNGASSGAVAVNPSGSVAVSATGVPAAAAAVAATDEKNEKVVEAADGTKALIVQANAAANCAEELSQIAGTEGTCTFWTGASSDKPDISWTFKGTDLDPDGDLNMDLGVTVSEKGTGTVADVLANAKDSLVMDWQQEGPLPGKASVYVRTAGKYADGTTLSLFCFNKDTGKFELQKSGITVTSGYASFDMDHCSTWALSTDDLTKYSASTLDSSNAGDQKDSVLEDIAHVNTEGATDGLPVAAIVALIIAALAVIAIIIAVVLRKRNARAIEPDTLSDTTDDAAVVDSKAAVSDTDADMIDSADADSDVDGEASSLTEGADSDLSADSEIADESEDQTKAESAGTSEDEFEPEDKPESDDTSKDESDESAATDVAKDDKA